MKSLVLGIDLGTSYFKLAIFDRNGQMKGLGRDAIRPNREAGRCEVPVEAYWGALRQGLSQALAQANANVKDIAAISYATQANSFLLVDRDGRPLTPILLWPDGRADAEPDPIGFLANLPGFADRSGVGVTLEAVFMAAKIRWFQRHQPELWARCGRVLTVSDYLAYGLTGEFVGDSGSAALTGLIDARTGEWWREALEACGLTEDRLPRLLLPASNAGVAKGHFAREIGLSADVPVAVGSMDHHVAALGAGVGALGECSVSLGTVLACAAPAKSYAPAENLCLAPGISGGYYGLTFNSHGASSLEWYQRMRTGEASIEKLVSAAEEVPAGSDGLRAAPTNPHPSVAFAGHRPHHEHGHHVRAIMESVADGLPACLAILPTERPIKRILATGGGAKSDLWLSMLAERTGATLIRPDCQEPAARGAAMIAATAAGWFKSTAEAATAWAKVQSVIAPPK